MRIAPREETREPGRDATRSTPEFLTEQQRMLAEVEATGRSTFAPLAERWDRENRFPAENFRLMQERGWLRIPVSRRHGGLGCGLHDNPVRWVDFVRALSKTCGNTGQTFQIWGHCISMIEELATPDQAARFVREALDGAIWCSGGSEPANYTQRRQMASAAKVRATAETTAKARTTFARKVEGGVRVSGRKLFISNSTAADRFFIFAELVSSEGQSLGLVHPVIRRGTPGLKVFDSWDAMGMRGTASNDLVIDDVFVPDEDVVGLDRPNAYFTSVLAGSFLVGRAAVYMGIADAAFEYLVEYVSQTIKAGDDPVMQFRIGQLEMRRQAAAAILYRAAEMWSQALDGKSDPEECASFAAMTHCSVIEGALVVTSEALELCGGRGMLRSAPLERYYRDVRAYSVSPPTINSTMVNIGSRILAPRAIVETLVSEGV
ncbi:MAG: acyl-CoA/acyl-ACP dehydrogenase [Alphaproteobacteria bacterium]|nr:acyl-CoA/acyl-ACP dehydrogenase [Alphaproteobacteria bacterium]